jgi:hypothetical protein
MILLIFYAFIQAGATVGWAFLSRKNQSRAVFPHLIWPVCAGLVFVGPKFAY